MITKTHELSYYRENFYFDKKAANNACKFFEREIRHVKGHMQGKRVKLERWQRRVISRIYGWKWKSTGLRVIRKVFIFIPRKNSKTFMAAGFGGLGLFADNEPGAEVVSLATAEEQAALVFEVLSWNVNNNKKLASLGTVYNTSITVTETASSWKVLSSEVGNKHGKNVSMMIADEVHEFPNSDLVDVIETSMGTRRQPLSIYLTTAGYDRTSYCYRLYDYACKVRDGIIDNPAFLPVIYEAVPPPPDPETNEVDPTWWHKPEVWEKANPMYGVSIFPEFLQDEFQKALDMPSYENTFKRLYLNIWTEQDVRWMPMDKWDACNAPIDLEAVSKREAWLGVDLSSVDDITAAVLIFPYIDHATGLPGYDVLPYFWIPEGSIEARERRSGIEFSVWKRKGLLKTTPGNAINYGFVRADLNALKSKFMIRQVVMDPWNALKLGQELTDDDFDVAVFGQAFKNLNAPTKELYTLVADQRIRHGGNPILRWMASNVQAETDSSANIKLSKKKSSEKIDGISALVNAIGMAMVATPNKSVYQKRGVLVW